MGIWTESVEIKASIIHAQLAAARELAARNHGSEHEASQPYLKLLNSLYADEFPFAQLVDSSDLVARFSGPAVDVSDPTVSIVISVFSDIREQIRSIARSVVGLAIDKQVRWPSNLDPHLAGIARGSLIVGVSVSPPTLQHAREQLELEGISETILSSVRTAVRSLATIGRHIGDSGMTASFREFFPDPAVRDTVLVAAKRLAPTGRRGIDSVTFFSDETAEATVPVLTPKSRAVLAGALAAPVLQPGKGDFSGTLREVDLDARRFEIRGVEGIGSIRCVYSERHDTLVRLALDARVKVSGGYESLAGGRPRLVAVESLVLVEAPPTQLRLPDEA